MSVQNPSSSRGPYEYSDADIRRRRQQALEDARAIIREEVVRRRAIDRVLRERKRMGFTIPGHD